MRRESVGLQVSLDVEGKRALVIGGGPEAADKTERLLDAGAWVTVVAPIAGPAVARMGAEGRVHLVRREFLPGDVNAADVVLVCLPDPALARRVAEAADQVGAAFWAADDPEPSHLAMPALARLGRARIAISTGGAAPALASKLREALERDLGSTFAAFVDRLGAERERILAEVPDQEERRRLLRALVEGFEVKVEVKYPEAPPAASTDPA